MTSTTAVATSHPVHPQTIGATAVLDRIGSVIVGILRRIAAAHMRARTQRILRSLNDGALRDIGLTRGQIDSVEQDPRYRPRYVRL